MKKQLGIMAGAAALAFMATSAIAADKNEKQESWLDHTISPVANPIFFEDAKVNSEIHPVYMWHKLPETFEFAGGKVPLGGQVQVLAVQARFAVTERLAIIATKDGYVQFQPNHTLDGQYGWADLAAGVKYALIKNEDRQFILTPGISATIPTGNRSVGQGHGAGEENIFVSAEKGFGDFHILGNAGVRVPNNWAADTCQLHYSLQADYYLGKYLIPFVALNGYTVLSDGSQNFLPVPESTEMYDLINSGATQASGRTQITLGGGFRSRIMKDLDFGLAYEAGITRPVGIFQSRLTLDFVFRF
jgi:hypothetical protein